MAVTYLRHPTHGEMAESNSAMVGIAKSNGWVEFDPTVKPVALPSFFGTPIPEDFPARAWLVKAGHNTMENIPRVVDELVAIDGIGNATALKVLDALEG